MTAGIHHVTALAGDPQDNVDFYAGLLGLRMVKRTVNFDDPGTYHFYYGDERGRPGTILTFFPKPGASRGQHGSGQVPLTAFSIPAGSADHWTRRLEAADFVVETSVRFDEEVLEVRDPDGLRLGLVAGPGASAQGPREPWSESSVPAEHAVRGLHSVTLASRARDVTAELLVEVLGARLALEASDRQRFRFPGDGPGVLVNLVQAVDEPPGTGGAGSVHHVAWRVADAEQQGRIRDEVASRGLDVTSVFDRNYFRSIYFREPGGILFEIATDGPGFSVDEPVGSLGSRLKLPEWLEADRDKIESSLPAIRLPGTGI